METGQGGMESTRDWEKQSKELKAGMTQAGRQREAAEIGQAGGREKGLWAPELLPWWPFYPGSFSPTLQRGSSDCSFGHTIITEGIKNHDYKGPITPPSPRQA